MLKCKCGTPQRGAGHVLQTLTERETDVWKREDPWLLLGDSDGL